MQCTAVRTLRGALALLGEQRDKAFSEREADPSAATQLLRHAARFDWSLYERPALEDVQSVLDRMADTAPGPDGVPFSSWKAGGGACCAGDLLAGPRHAAGRSLPRFARRGACHTHRSLGCTSHWRPRARQKGFGTL